jgi:hypothetical protein
LNAVVGVTGFFTNGALKSMGIQCALCHSTVDDGFAPGIGRRLDGWPNRDLDIGAIVALAPTLKPYTDLLGADDATVRKVLRSWGPGKFDAQLTLDGKTFRPDGKSAATLNPAAFGLAGVNQHTWTGSWGSITYWNAFVANLEMHGKGNFFDPRLSNKEQYPVAARANLGNVRASEDRITPKLAALHFYQLALPAPRPPAGSFDPTAAARGKTVFEGKAGSPAATCRRSTPSPVGTCTPPRRSASTTSRRRAHRTGAIAPRRCAACGRTPPAASITMGASPPCPP